MSDDLWQVDRYGPGEAGSNVVPVVAVYHQCGDGVNVVEEITDRSARVVCSCGSVFEQGEMA